MARGPFPPLPFAMKHGASASATSTASAPRRERGAMVRLGSPRLARGFAALGVCGASD